MVKSVMIKTATGKFGTLTPYRGQKRRSVAEARWNAFFDMLGCEWEYEPYRVYEDAGRYNGYLPDFLLRDVAVGGFKYGRLWVEVKGMADNTDERNISCFKEPILVLPPMLKADTPEKLLADITELAKRPLAGTSNVYPFSFRHMTGLPYAALPAVDLNGRLEIFSLSLGSPVWPAKADMKRTFALYRAMVETPAAGLSFIREKHTWETALANAKTADTLSPCDALMYYFKLKPYQPFALAGRGNTHFEGSYRFSPSTLEKYDGAAWKEIPRMLLPLMAGEAVPLPYPRPFIEGAPYWGFLVRDNELVLFHSVWHALNEVCRTLKEKGFAFHTKAEALAYRDMLKRVLPQYPPALKAVWDAAEQTVFV